MLETISIFFPAHFFHYTLLQLVFGCVEIVDISLIIYILIYWMRIGKGNEYFCLLLFDTLMILNEYLDE